MQMASDESIELMQISEGQRREQSNIYSEVELVN